MATVKKIKKAQVGNIIKSALKSVGKNIVKNTEKSAAKNVEKKAVRSSETPLKKGLTLRQQEAKAALNKAIQKRTSPTRPSWMDEFDLPPSKSEFEKTSRLSAPKGKLGGKVTKAKSGKQMIKRADGTYSQRGLWDNIRANKGSGKKPTAAMLKQEKKIKAKSKK